MFSAALETELDVALGRSGAEYDVIGADTRRRVTPTTVEPYKHVCQIRASLRHQKVNGDWATVIGSGTLVAPNKVLTAAHVVYSHKYKELARDVRVTPAKDGWSTGPRDEPYGFARVSRLDVPGGFRAGDAGLRSANDYAVITLTDRIGDRPPRDPALGTGPLGWWRLLVALSDTSLRNTLIVGTTGYPADHGGNRMYTTQNRLGVATADRLTYQDDTVTGQSGGPLWLRREDRWALIGVHTEGFDPPQPPQNSGVRLNATNLPVIAGWLRT